MDNYRVKNYLWIVIALLFVVIFLAGCGSTPKIADNGHQYCFNNKKITVKDGKEVSSESVTTCSDDVVGKLVDVKAGLAKNCGYADMFMVKGNSHVLRKVIICQDPNGDSNILFSTATK